MELVLSSEVHPYDLLRYEHAVFSRDAIEALEETLKKTVSKRGTATAERQAAAAEAKPAKRKKTAKEVA